MLKTTPFNILILTKKLAFFKPYLPKTTIIRAFLPLLITFFGIFSRQVTKIIFVGKIFKCRRILWIKRIASALHSKE